MGPVPSAGAVLQMIDVARRHLVEGETLVDIANQLGLSRFKVARLVRDARANGFVTVTVSAPGGVDLAASDSLREGWPALEEAIVVPTPPTDGGVPLRDALAKAAADIVSERVSGVDDVLGLACGRTVNRMASFIRALPACSIVQLTGVTSNSMADSSIRTMQQVAATSHGRAFPIYAPMFLESATLVGALSQEPAVAAATSKFSKLTHGVVTVGGWSESESTMYSLVPPAMRRRLTDRGAVAEFNGHLLDSDGNEVGAEFTDRCITVGLEDLANTPQLLVVAGGPGRRAALHATLTGGHVRRLITDSETANWLVGSARR